MVDVDYNPAKAHEYYLRTRKLKGRPKGVTKPLGLKQKPVVENTSKKAQDRVVRLTQKLNRLRKALHEAETALRQSEQTKRENKDKAEKESSDNKTTAKERQASKEYRDKHKSEIASKRDDESDTESADVSSMSKSELKERVGKLKTLISDARNQLARAAALAHSSIDETSNHLSHSGHPGRYHTSKGDSQNGR